MRTLEPTHRPRLEDPTPTAPTTGAQPQAGEPSSPRAPRRLQAIGLTVTAALVAWAIADPMLGVNLQAPAMGDQPGQDIGPLAVGMAALVASLAGWALLAVMERFAGGHARRAWVVSALAVLILSLGGPFSGAGVDLVSRVWLATMHVVVAAVLIPSLARTSSRR